MISDKTNDNGDIDRDFLLKYKLSDSDIKPFNINCFHLIACSYPLSVDIIFIQGSLDDAHYIVMPENHNDLIYP